MSYRPNGYERHVKVHDFEDKEPGKVTPYGVYDIRANAGWDERRDHERYGRLSCGPNPGNGSTAWAQALCKCLRELTITANCGGWKGKRQAVEDRAAEVRQQDSGVALETYTRGYPTGRIEVEQNQAPPPLPHLAQTWRGRGLTDSIGCRRADRSDDNQGRPENRERAGHARLRTGHQGQRCPDEGARRSR